ncbi:unnamed protein product, partial [Allacma fusca]
SYTVDA